MAAFPKLALDIGNTAIKAILWPHAETEWQFLHFQNIAEFLAFLQTGGINTLAFCKSGRLEESARQKFFAFVPYVRELSYETSTPLRNLYKTPQTLGMDRLAAALGATALFPKQNCLIADAGTCLTLDFVHAEGIFMGGNISPGLDMRFRSLNEYTAKLPLLSLEQENAPPLPQILGQSTEEAIYLGVVNGLLYEINSVYTAIKTQYNAPLRLLLCGGNAAFLTKHLHHNQQILPDLVLRGLMQLLDN